MALENRIRRTNKASGSTSLAANDGRCGASLLVVAAISVAVAGGCSLIGGSGPDATALGSADRRFPITGSAQSELARFDQAFSVYADNPAETRYRKHFRDAYRRVRVMYVRPVTDGSLVDAALEGIKAEGFEPGGVPGDQLVSAALDAMTTDLDPHSAYLDPAELREAEATTTGQFGGLGIQVTQEEGAIKVIAPIEGTPADRAGVKSGDVITHVDGRSVAELSLTQAVRAMRGEPGTKIRLRIARIGASPFDVSLTRAVISIKPVRWATYGTVGYMRIVGFSDRTYPALREAVSEIRASLGDSASGLVIDLRNNPGGLFDQSIEVADAFLDDGMIVSVRGRHARTSRGFEARRGDIADGLPIVVLINGGSASASEIVASALQDQERAIVMGSRSFGKGSVQTVIRLPIEGALKLTTALYYSPSGRTIQSNGVIPDIRLGGVEVPPNAVREADLPGALEARLEADDSTLAELDVDQCPAVADRDDRSIGCAVALLEAGSVDRFISRLPASNTALKARRPSG